MLKIFWLLSNVDSVNPWVALTSELLECLEQLRVCRGFQIVCAVYKQGRIHIKNIYCLITYFIHFIWEWQSNPIQPLDIDKCVLYISQSFLPINAITRLEQTFVNNTFQFHMRIKYEESNNFTCVVVYYSILAWYVWFLFKVNKSSN